MAKHARNRLGLLKMCFQLEYKPAGYYLQKHVKIQIAASELSLGRLDAIHSRVVKIISMPVAFLSWNAIQPLDERRPYHRISHGDLPPLPSSMLPPPPLVPPGH